MPANTLLASIAAVVLAGLGPMAATPAWAEPTTPLTESLKANDVTLTIVHQAQPAAYQGEAIALPVAVVSDCAVPRPSVARLCSEVRLEVHWRTAVGGGVLADHTPGSGGARTFLIPGDAVEGDLTYWIEASQSAADLAQPEQWTDRFTARSPSSDALFRVSVIND